MTVVRLSRRVIAFEFMLAVAVIAYAGCHDVRDVLAGTPSAIAVDATAHCESTDRGHPCKVRTTRLNPGRYRFWTMGEADSLTVDLKETGSRRVRTVMARITAPQDVMMTVGSQPSVEIAQGKRAVASVASGEPLTITFTTATAQSTPTPIVVDEVGGYADSRGLLSDTRPFFPKIPPLRYHATMIPRAVASLCFFTMVAAIFLPPGPLRRVTPLVLPIVCFALCFLDLSVLFSPYFNRDLRAMYASSPLQEAPGSNLNSGLYQASRLLAGSGLTTEDGVVPWERMPGYGLFCALAAILFGHETLVDLAISVVLLQTIFYSVALGVFAWAAARLFTPAAVWTTGLIIAWLPKQVGYTQVDAIIAPVALLVLAALCVRLARVQSGNSVPVAIDVAVHSTFGLWFLMRPDVLPGWLAVSLVLHWKNWRRLLVPLAFFLVIGVTWGAYKARYTGEFALTTTSAGASLFCGLWEVPSRFRLALPCTDERYFDWIRQNASVHPQSMAANSFATREVLKFWATYPGHLAIMLYGKMMRVIDGDVWPGNVTQLQTSVFNVVPRFWLVLSLLTVIAACVAIGYRRSRTLLLSWPLLLDAPLFWVMYASLGRFYSAVGVALVVAALPPLLESQFYAAVARRPWRTVSVVACAALLAATAWPVYSWLLGNDAFHYWTPLLDPSFSRLAGFK
jgi:hypothetical protein